MLELGIDEMTIILQPSPSVKAGLTPSNWPGIAEAMIRTFEGKAGFATILGGRHTAKQAPSGYSTAYVYGEHDFYLAVAYHPCQPRMGVIVKFSAQALAYYLEATGRRAFQFLQAVVDSRYTIRLSRVDVTADFIDEGIDVTKIYQGFIDNKIGVFRESIGKTTGQVEYRRVEMQYRGFLRGQEVPTLYLGSSMSSSLLRVYDKRLEQIERRGSKLAKAVQSHDWVRFEGCFKHEYAHQISEQLLKVRSDDEFGNLVAGLLTQKFRLMYIDRGVVEDDTEYTRALLDCITNNSFTLTAPLSRNFDLARSLEHLLYGSGAVSTLYKVQMIWGKAATRDALDLIEQRVDVLVPNEDTRRWLRNNMGDYQRHYHDFDTFKTDNLAVVV